MLQDAFMAGVWSSIGSTLGKIAATPDIVGKDYFLWIVLLTVMIAVNTLGCRCYLRALDAAHNSVAPAVIASAISYVLSGLVGVTMFNETSTLRWWIGTMLIVQGLALVSRHR